jgi:ABC-type glycerol-3-phosphate transport system substrate-binding protein
MTYMRRHSKTTLMMIGAAAVLGIVLSGCTTSGGPSSTDGADDSSFTYWSMWNQNEPQAQILSSAIDQFTADTGIHVDVQWQGRDVVTKLLPTLKSGAAADLVDGSVNALGPLTSNDLQLDLSDAYAESVPGDDKPLSEIIPQPYRDALTDEGATSPSMVPYEVLSEAVWYDSARFGDLSGATGSWDEFVTALNKITDSGTPAVAIPSNDAYWLTLLLERSLGVDGLRALATDKSGAAWDEKGVREALDAFDQLRPSFPAGYAASQGSDAQNLWASGGAATYLSGTWVPSEAAPNVSSDFTFDSVQLPALKAGGDTSVGVNFIGFTIPQTAAHSTAAAKFIAYFSQKQFADRVASEAVQISPREDVTVPEQLASIAEALKSNDLYPDQGGLARDYPDWYSTIFRTMASGFVTGQYDSDTFVSESRRQTVDYLAANG